MQEKMENHFVGDLQGLGYRAVSSLKEYGPKTFDKMDEKEALDQLKNSGLDAVITIVLLQKKKEVKYVPPKTYYSPNGYPNSDFWGYSSTVYRQIYQSGYYATDTKYFWESNFYDMNTRKLLYSVQTQSFDPANSETMANEYGKLIVKDMVRQNVLNQQKKPEITLN